MEPSVPLISAPPVLAEYKVPMVMHQQNRAKLVDRLKALPKATGGFVLLQGGKTTEQYDTDHEIVFRQESNFQYLFGVEEADCLGGIDLATGKAMLFIPKLPESYAVWLGEIFPPAHFKTKYNLDEAHYIDDLPAVLKTLAPQVILTLPLKTACLADLPKLDGLAPMDGETLQPELYECRLIKSEEELKLMRHINRISSWAHLEVMKRCRPGMMEFELESLFLYLTYKNGRCRHQSYTCICAAGPASATLHYPNNNKEVKDGSMVLLDMGAEYHCYCSDITNSFPANGKFTPDQREIYNIVLAASRAVMGAMKPGIDWTDMHRLAERVICEGLIQLDLIRGNPAELQQHHIPALFFPHGLGHLLGLDTHDVGGYPAGMERIQEPGIRYLRTRRVLQPGMVITVEPGLYFIAANLEPALKDPVRSKYLNADKLARFRNFGGVRIEDDVVVTQTGIENLTQLPRTCEEIEAVMAAARLHKKNEE